MQAVGANTAVSILQTVTSNTLAVVTVPFVTASVLSMTGTLVFDPGAMCLRLAKTVLVPLLLGACLRTITSVCTSTPGHVCRMNHALTEPCTLL